MTGDGEGGCRGRYGGDGKFILQLYKAEVKSETGTIITAVGGV